MRLPYLQVTQETWDYADSLASLTGMDPGAAFRAICNMWRWALDLGPEDQPPAGECISPRADRLLAAGMKWAGEAGPLVDFLVDLGLVDRIPAGIRVKGLGRYKRTWEKNHRRPGGKVPETGTNTAPPAPKPAPQIKTQTQTQIEQLPTEVVVAPPQPKERQPAQGLTIVPPDKPPGEWVGLDFWAWAQSVRVESGLLPERPLHPNKLGPWWSGCLMTPGVSPEALKEGFYAFGHDKHWEKGTPPFPFVAFMAGWEKYTRPEASHGTAA